MTYDFYKSKQNNIQIQIEHLHSERQRLKFEYTEERRMLNKGQIVEYDGLKWMFTGNCEIEPNSGDVLYEIDNNSFVVYRTFEDLEL